MDSKLPKAIPKAAQDDSPTFPIVPVSNGPTPTIAKDASSTFPLVPVYSGPTPIIDGKYPIPGQPIDPFSVPPLFYIHKKKDPKTITETVSVTKTVFQISFATESQFLTLTDTVYVNKTVFNYVTLTHTDHVTHTKNNTVPMTVFATITAKETSSARAQATVKPDVSAQQGGGGHLKPVAIAFIVLGVVAGLAVVAGVAWYALRKYRGWKAKENQRMRGVELQREWEREQQVRKDMEEAGGMT